MALSYPLTLPARAPKHISFSANSVVGMSASPFSGSQQVYAHQGQFWSAEVELPPMDADDAEAWVGFLLGLNGVEGTFLMGDPTRTTVRGIGTGTPVVKGASQTGNTLLTDGWTAGQTAILKVGDWFQLGSGTGTRLHKVVQDANSDGSGNATLEIWPRLRSAPADNAALTIASAKGHWRLASNKRSWDIGEASIYGISFACVEAFE